MFPQLVFAIGVFFIPLFFVTATPNFFTTPKQFLLVILLLILTLNWAYQTFISNSLRLSASRLRFGLLGVGLVVLANLALYPEGRLEAVVGPGSIYLALLAWTYFLTIFSDHSLSNKLLYTFLGSTSLLALHSLLQLTFLSHLDTLPLYMQTRGFTPTGSPLTTFILLGLGAVTALSLTLKPTHSHGAIKILTLCAVFLNTVGLISLGALLLPGQELSPLLFPLRASWNIALDALKSFPSLFLGIGLGNFGSFSQSVKPLFLNLTPFWNITPTNGGSELLNLLTTTGILGLLAFLALPLLSFPTRLQSSPSPLYILTILAGLALVLLPGTFPILFIFFTGLGLLAATPASSHTLTRAGSASFALFALSICLLVGYGAATVVRAESHLRRAQLALQNNDGKKVYEQTLSAVKLLPAMSNYRLSYSQVNLSLAGALSQKQTLADSEREQVSQLVSQAIREGKLAASLRPHDSASWVNLGHIYRNLVNVADGADQFAVSAFAQAVSLDPGNPALRVEFGGLLYQLAQNSQKTEDKNNLYARAQSEFQTAIQLKNDYANAYYNLSKLLESTGDVSNAYLAMQKSLSLLGPDSPDLGRATSELETLKSKLPARSASQSDAGEPKPTPAESDLSAPSPLPSPLPGGPLEIPTD